MAARAIYGALRCSAVQPADRTCSCPVARPGEAPISVLGCDCETGSYGTRTSTCHLLSSPGRKMNINVELEPIEQRVQEYANPQMRYIKTLPWLFCCGKAASSRR